MMKFSHLAWLLALALTGCAAHSPMIIKTTTDARQVSANKYAAHDKQVFVTADSLPSTAKYEVLGRVEVRRGWYGSADNALADLADGARKLGADAVVEVKTWHQPSAWAWSAPHGSGLAVKIVDPGSVDFAEMEGSWK